MSELIPTGYTYDQGRIAINDSFSATGYFNNIEAIANITGTTYYSGATPLELIIQNLAVAGSVTHIQNGTNTFTGGTPTNPTVNITGGTINNLNITGGTLSSGGTDLYSIFLTSAGANDITRVEPGLNTYTGGTENNPTVNISAATLTYLSATTISGGTLYSGSTDLYDIFCTDCGGTGSTGFSGFSSSTGAFSIIENNGSGNLANDSYGYAGGNGAYSNNYGERSWSNGHLGQCGYISWYGSTTLIPSNIAEIFMDGGSLSKKFVIPLNSSYFVDMTVTARIIGGPANGDSAAWTAEGMIKNIGGVVSLATDTLYGSPFFMIQKAGDTSFLTSNIIISAETATSALTVTVIGPDDNADWYVQASYTKVK